MSSLGTATHHGGIFARGERLHKRASAPPGTGYCAGDRVKPFLPASTLVPSENVTVSGAPV